MTDVPLTMTAILTLEADMTPPAVVIVGLLVQKVRNSPKTDTKKDLEEKLNQIKNKYQSSRGLLLVPV